MKTLRCAVPKGRPMRDIVPFFEQMGGEGLGDVSRQLTVYDAGLDMTYFLSKSMDVPTYVEYGAADIGIAGKDVLLEQNRPVIELLDLNISRCRLVLAVPETSHVHAIGDISPNARVATKYPRVTEQYFNEHGIQVELIPLSGSIELAPLVDLADAVVDITETGATLRQNGLRIIGEITDSSMRLIANPIAFKVAFDRIYAMTEQLREIVADTAGNPGDKASPSTQEKASTHDSTRRDGVVSP